MAGQNPSPVANHVVDYYLISHCLRRKDASRCLWRPPSGFRTANHLIDRIKVNRLISRVIGGEEDMKLESWNIFQRSGEEKKMVLGRRFLIEIQLNEIEER